MEIKAQAPEKNVNKLRRLVLALVTSVLLPSLIAETYEINSAEELSGLALSAGDEVIWEDGAYADEEIALNAEGSEAQPILLRAETPGGVVFSGDSQLNIGGRHLIVEGFYWNGSLGSTGVVEFRESGATEFGEFAQNSTLRNCAFNNLVTAGDDKSRWVMLYGTGNRVEFCSFLNKESTGACVLVELANQGENDVVAGHRIQNNYFYNFPPKDGRVNDGDSEAIRIGESAFQAMEGGVLVENNYFVETSGENEIISNKSRNNRYLNNTFRRSRGALVLRHGSGTRVEGNYFLGEGAADSGGIRISDGNHVIINNYMEGLRGSIWNSAIVWMGGNAPSGGSSSGYQYVENVLFAFNSIYDATEVMNMNERKGGTAPAGVTMANNLVYSTRGELIVGEESLSAAGISFQGNIFSGSPVGYESDGISAVNPQMALEDGLFRPAADGPAADAATGDFPEVTRDVEGRSRPESGMDIGALEVNGSEGSRMNLPATEDDIGAFVGSTFIDKTNTCSDCPDPGDTQDPGDGDDDDDDDDNGDDDDDDFQPPPGGTDDSGAGLLPSEDAYVSAGDDGDRNFGGEDKLVVKAENEYSKQSFLKFPLSGATDGVVAATLRIKVRSTAPSTHTVYAVSDDSWSASSITWNARPATDRSLDSRDMVAVDTWMEFDVTSFVAEEARGDQIASFALSSDRASTINYYSSDSPRRADYPELLIATDQDGGTGQSWRGFEVLYEDSGYWYVDTGEFMGPLWVYAEGGWMYCVNLNKWIYFHGTAPIENGVFAFVPRW